MYIGIVIINYKTPELTIAGLQALFESEISYDFHVAIVENFSNDGSFEKIEIAIRENNWQNKVTMINSSFNGGFAYGCNLGIRFHQQRQSTDFFWMLNPDAAVRPQALEELIEVFKTNSKLGIAGSRLENKDGSKRNASFTFHSWKTEFLRGFGLAIFDRLMSANIQKIVSSEEDIHPSQTDWISGASMMIRKEVVDDIGYFDEKYFLYFEEMDYCLKAKKAGWQRWHVPKSRVMHFAGSSSGVNAVNQLEKGDQLIGLIRGEDFSLKIMESFMLL